VRDDSRCRTDLSIHVDQRLQYQTARFGVQRSRRLVAQEHVGTFGDGARDRNALLFSARQLRRKVIEPVTQADQAKRVLGPHRIRRDLRHQRDVLSRGETRDQIIELKHESHVLATILRQRAVVGRDEVVIAEVDDTARRRIEAAEDVE
jgi:hypothetical protein